MTTPIITKANPGQTCPLCGQPVGAVHVHLSQLGKKGGSAGRGKAKARTAEQMSRASKLRWERARAKPNNAP